MAARSSHVDLCVNERRLRPIYDCLDNGNNKKALQEAEKLLKKQKDFQCAKVLKALALIRLGKQDEASVVLKEVHSEIPIDDPTLQAMSICYRELHKPESIADAYEAAIKKDPLNEEFMTQLFMAYVRLGDNKKQQQVAMTLYKLKPKNPYYFWAVMSIVMQAQNNDEKLAMTMLLPLAQRMTEKFIKENKIEAEAEVQLYLMILELQGKLEEALAVLDGPLGERLTSYVHYNAQRRAEFIAQLQRWEEANSAYRRLLLENPDQWSFYLEYFRTGFALHESRLHPQKDCDSVACDYTSTLMSEFVVARIHDEEKKTSRCLRGPYLARFELLRQLIERKDPVAQTLGKTSELLLAYYDKFGTRGCFFADVKPFLLMLNEEDSSQLLDKIHNLISKENNGIIPDAKSEKELQRHINFVQLCEYFGRHNRMNVAQQSELAFDLVRRYNIYTQTENNLLATDYHPADLYCILASHLFIKIWQHTRDSKLIWQPITLLEKGMKNSPCNHQIKLLLIKLYNCIGAIEVSFALYESLDIKHIQQDSLGYLVTRHLSAKGLYSEACNVFGNTLKFFLANHKDTVDYLIAAYKFGSFTKINEFVKFRERLDNSLQYALVAVERMILDIILEANNHASTEKNIAFLDIDPDKDKPEKWEHLRDNRDLTLMVGWERFEKQEFDEAIAASFESEVEWLKMRTLLVRSLATAYLLSQSNNEAKESEKHSTRNDMTNGEQKNVAHLLQGLVTQLEETSERFKTLPKSPIGGSLLMPEPSRLEFYKDDVYLEIFIRLQEYLLRLNSFIEKGESEKEESSHDRDDAIQTKIINLLEGVIGRYANIALKEDLTANYGKWNSLLRLEPLANITETISFAAALTGFCHRILKPALNALNRKSKRKKEIKAFHMPQTFSNFNAMVNGLEKAATNFQLCLQELRVTLSLSDMERLDLDDQILPCGEDTTTILSEIQTKVKNSHQHSLAQMEDLVSNKLKYLVSLRL